jgi:hypothetical protein
MAMNNIFFPPWLICCVRPDRCYPAAPSKHRAATCLRHQAPALEISALILHYRPTIA